ncbi:MAG: helix-turn-helix transcriptional regulator [Rhizobiaceae bacterium]
MTPFGERMRQLRAEKRVTQKDMAAAIGVTPAYLSALEHGRRGAPAWPMIQRIIGYFNVIWDDAEDLQRLAEMSRGRVIVDTQNLSPRATELANLLAASISKLDEETLDNLALRIRAAAARNKR